MCPKGQNTVLLFEAKVEERKHRPLSILLAFLFLPGPSIRKPKLSEYSFIMHNRP